MTRTQIMHLCIWGYFQGAGITFLLDEDQEEAFWAGHQIANTPAYAIGHESWRDRK